MPVTVIFGAGGIGTGNFASTWDTPNKVSSLLSSLTEPGVSQLDSAASYPPGNPWNTETLLGQTRAIEKGFVIDTRILFSSGVEERRVNLSEKSIDSSIERSLRLLGTEKVAGIHKHSL